MLIQVSLFFFFLAMSIKFGFSFELGGYKINGNNSLGIEFSKIDNDYYKTVYPEGIADGYNVEDDFFIQTKIEEFNLTGLGSFITNDEDVAFRKVFFELSKDKYIMNLGDVYPQESELSMSNIRIRGLKIEYNDEYTDNSYKYNLMQPLFMSLKEGHLVNQELPSSYFAKKNMTRFIKNLNFKLYTGYAYVSTNVNKTRTTTEPPEQFFSGLRTNLSLAGNNDIGIGLLTAKDQETKSGYDTQKGSLYSIDYKKRIESSFAKNDKITVYGEYAKSDYDKNLNDTDGSKTKDAFYGGVNYEYKKIEVKTKFYKYGKDFKSLGNPYIQVDKRGYYSELNYSVCNTYFFNASYEDYRNNLDNDINDTKVTTKVFFPTLRVKFPDVPELIMYYQGTKTDNCKGFSETDKKDYSIASNIAMSIFNINLNYKHTDYDDFLTGDSNTYKSNGYSLGLNYSFLNNRINMFHFFYKDKFDYKSNSQTKNTFITLNSNLQLIPNKINVNPVFEYRKSEKDNTNLLNVKNFDISVEYILDFTKQIGFKFRWTDEDYEGTILDDKIYAGKIEYKVNF